jgi:hypothetical protein
MTTHPRQFTDRHNRLWTWADEFGGYRHDNGVMTRLADLEDIAAEAGPLTAPDTGGKVDDLNVVAEQWLELKAKTTPPGNVFEWCWECSRGSHLAREVLLRLAWDWDSEDEPEPWNRTPPWPGYSCLALDFDEFPVDDIARAVIELVALDELHIDELAVARTGADLSRGCPDVAYSFPAYRNWLAEQATTDPELAAAKTALDSWRAT